MNKEEFLKKAKEFHGNDFDYSNLNYINNKTALEFKCNLCFSVSKITPEKHLRTKCKCFLKIKKEEKYLNNFKTRFERFSNLELISISYKDKKANICCSICKKYSIINTEKFVNCSCQRTFIRSTEDFIKKGILLFNNKFNYSKVNYINSKIKVNIICNNCNSVFNIYPFSHFVKNGGCPNCKEKYRIKSISTTAEEFIKKANELTNFNYNFDKVNETFVNMKTKVKITCKKCNTESLIHPERFLRKNGCKICIINNIKFSQFDFLRLCNSYYKNKFNFNKAEYKTNKSKIIVNCISCNKDFIRHASTLLKGKTICPFCYKKNKNFNEEDLNIFLEKAKNINSLLDYNKVIYKGHNKKIIVICKKCNFEFETKPDYILQKANSANCSNCKLLEKNKINSIKFINILKNKFGEENLNFDKVKYENCLKPITLICKIHNYEFKKKPTILTSAKSKFACFKCNVSKSSAENYFEEFLIKNNIIYKTQQKVNKWKIDFCLENQLFVQIDGEYVHGIGRDLNEIKEFKTKRDRSIYYAKIRDIKQNNYFKANNLKLLRITDQQLKKISEDDLFNLIVENL